MSQLSINILLNFLFIILIYHWIVFAEKLKASKTVEEITQELSSRINKTYNVKNDGVSSGMDSSVNFMTAIYLNKMIGSSEKSRLDEFNLTDYEYKLINGSDTIACFKLKNSSLNLHSNFVQDLIFNNPHLPLHTTLMSAHLRLFKIKTIEPDDENRDFFYLSIYENTTTYHKNIDNHWRHLYHIRDEYNGWISLDITPEVFSWISDKLIHCLSVSVQRVKDEIQTITDVGINLVNNRDGKQPFILAFFKRFENDENNSDEETVTG